MNSTVIARAVQQVLSLIIMGETCVLYSVESFCIVAVWNLLLMSDASSVGLFTLPLCAVTWLRHGEQTAEVLCNVKLIPVSPTVKVKREFLKRCEASERVCGLMWLCLSELFLLSKVLIHTERPCVFSCCFASEVLHVGMRKAWQKKKNVWNITLGRFLANRLCLM